MKISFEAKRLFNNFTGLGNYARTLVGNLQREYPQHKYVLYTPRKRDSADTSAFNNPAHFEVVAPQSKRFASLWRSWGVLRNIKADKPDIYHGLSHDLPFSVNRKNKDQTKYVVTIHDLCYLTFPKMYAKVERAIYRKKYSHALKTADAIVAISESTKNDILKYYPWVDESKIVTIYQSLNPIYYQMMEVEHAREVVAKYGITGDYMLYVGSINERKNLLGVIKAYALIEPSSRVPLVIVGSGGTYKKEVEQYAQSHDLSHLLHFLDKVTLVETLRCFYTASQGLIYPSFYEGFGLPVAEALLCGVPVVTSSVSSMPEAGGDGALYVDPNSPQQIADAIVTISTQREYALSLAQKGREYVLRTFAVEDLTAQMMGLYESLIGENK